MFWRNRRGVSTMSWRKGVLAVIMVGLILVSAMSLVGYDLYLPSAAFSESALGDADRLVVIRSAAFLTMAFFIYRHLGRKRPLSSVVPLQVFVNFLIVVGLFRMRFSSEYWLEWVILGVLLALSALLYYENRSESQRIFKDDW